MYCILRTRPLATGHRPLTTSHSAPSIAEVEVEVGVEVEVEVQVQVQVEVEVDVEAVSFSKVKPSG